MSAPGRVPVAALALMQQRLQQRERGLLELGHMRRADGMERVRDAIRRLGEVGSPAGVLVRAAQELGSASQFDRVLISEVADGELRPLTIWSREPPAELPEAAVELAYPLVEHELLRGRETQLVDVSEVASRTPAAFREALGWQAYVVAPIVVEGQVIGLLHGDATASGRPLDEVDRELAAVACTGLGEVFDRAVLRETLELHRAELRSAVDWLGGRLRTVAAGSQPGPPTPGGEGVGRVAADTLTPREREILALTARGLTNAAIAETLVIREGTVKYHVKNLLRKLGARSRADAVARYARATGTTPR